MQILLIVVAFLMFEDLMLNWFLQLLVFSYVWLGILLKPILLRWSRENRITFSPLFMCASTLQMLIPVVAVRTNWFSYWD